MSSIRCVKTQHWGGHLDQCELSGGHEGHHKNGGLCWDGDGDYPGPDVDVKAERDAAIEEMGGAS